MFRLLSLLVVVGCFLIGTLAQASSTVARCFIPVQQNNPPAYIKVLYSGTGKNSNTSFGVHYVSGQINKVFPVDQLNWADNGNTLNLRFARFMIMVIHQGHRIDNTMGVALGAPPRPMDCRAVFPLK